MLSAHDRELLQTRRHFFGKTATGIGTAALASLLNPQLFAATPSAETSLEGRGGILKSTHFKPTAKRVIYLFMSGRRRSWICTITNPRCRRCSTKICRIPSGRGSG